MTGQENSYKRAKIIKTDFLINILKIKPLKLFITTKLYNIIQISKIRKTIFYIKILSDRKNHSAQRQPRENRIFYRSRQNAQEYRNLKIRKIRPNFI